MYDLVKLKRDFLSYLETGRGRSEKTLENYDRYLGRFFDFGKIKKPTDITAEQVQRFRAHLSRQPGVKVGGQQAPMKLRTQNYYLIAIRSFLRYLEKRGIEALSPKRIELAKVPERSLDLISGAEIERLLRAPDPKSLEGKRDRAILELLTSTGIRISELCSLSRGDVDLSRNEFSVRGRGNKVRTVYLSESTRKALRTYLQSRKDLDDALFIRYGRKQNDGGDLRIGPRAVQRLIKKYAAEAGITHRVTPQTIRHHYATNLLRSGVDVHRVQALLGHVTGTSTQGYAKMNGAQLRARQEK